MTTADAAGGTEFAPNRRRSGVGRARRLRSGANADDDDDVAAAPSKFPKHFMQIYDVGEKLGEGGNSTVWQCVHKVSRKARAVKKVDTADLPPNEIAYEIAIMRLLRHESVVKCHDVFLEDKFVNIVVDLFGGGDLIVGLRQHRSTRGAISNSQLANLTSQMMAAVAHIHGLSVVHRDVKGENFLTDLTDIGNPKCRVALADFGTAVIIQEREMLTQQMGTRAYWSPELWRSSYDRKCDVWALGVTLYVLSAGALPFNGQEEIEKICTCPTSETDGRTLRSPLQRAIAAEKLTPDGNDFISACLTMDLQTRPSAEELLKHPFLTTPQKNAPTSGGIGSILLGCLLGLCTCFCELSGTPHTAKPAAIAPVPAEDAPEP